MFKRYIILLFLICNGSFLCAKKHEIKSRAVTCPVSNGAKFCNLNIIQNACVAGNLTVDGTIFAKAYGNTLIVDQINGDDVTGTVNGPSFKTIGAALVQAEEGDLVLIFPGEYNESIIIPSGVSVRGSSTSVVIIQKMNVIAATDLVTMGDNSRLEDVTLQLTSALHVTLRGIVFPGTTSGTATFNNSILIVDNAGAPTLGSSEVYGIHSNGTGQATEAISAVRDSTVLVNSIGGGKKRGILLDNANSFTIRDASIFVEGGSDSIGIETNDIDAELASYNSNLSGSSADISQTLGELEIVGTEFEHSQANGFGFETTILPSNYIWGDVDTPIGGGQLLYMRPGSSTASATPIFINASQKFLAKALSVRVIVPPGIG